MEDFVPYELAVKLKEKGFRKPCIAHYTCLDKNVLKFNITTDCIRGSNFKVLNNDYKIFTDVPTIYQALKWLREEKEVDLIIEPIFIYDENKRREYGVRVFAPQLNKPINCGYFNTWDDASTAGIEYVIDNLI